MSNIKFILVFLLTVCCLSVQAQISYGGLPSTITHSNSLRVAETIPCITIVPDTTEEVEANQFAYKNEVDIDLPNHASSSIVDDMIIYRLLIHSEKSTSINLIFNPIVLPVNAKMFLYKPNGREIYGAYTKESFDGDVFATTPVSGDSIMIQCEVPIANSDSFIATISSVNTGFDQLRLLPALGKAKDCETDVVCQFDRVEDQSRSACLIIINGTRYCSGSLIATNSDDPKSSFVLTSAHCLRNYSQNFDSTLAGKCVFYFGYNTPICEEQIIGSYERSISGSKVASFHHSKDMALLKLSSRPPVDYMTYESGWNIEQAPRGPVTSLHHPSGDMMKISICDNDPSPFSFDNVGLAENSHWLIDVWSVGITEDGSSGSPLYDRDGLIIGALSGGNSLCSNRGEDYYWRLNSVWDDILSKPVDVMSILDPSFQGISRLEGRETNPNRCYLLKNYESFSELNEPYSSEYGYASGKNTFGLDEFAEKFTSAYSSTEIYGVSFVPVVGIYDVNNPVYLRIYSGDDKPESLVYESVSKVMTREYTSKAGAFSNSLVNNWSYKENYVRLDSVVKVGKTFFVSLYTDYETNDFAMLTTLSDTKTAFFKKNGVWESWENHPFDSSVGSLMISAVVRGSDSESFKDLGGGVNVSIYPNPAQDVVRLKSGANIQKIKVYNALGSVCFQNDEVGNDQNFDVAVEIKDWTNGIYYVEILTDNGEYHTKFIKE